MKIYAFLFILVAFVGMLGSAWSFEHEILEVLNVGEENLALDRGNYQAVAGKGCGKKKDATSTTAAE